MIWSKQTACGISGSVMTSDWPFFYCHSWNSLLFSQQQWRCRMRSVKMVCSSLALSLHVLSRIVWVLQLHEELLGSELWLHCALPPLCCLSFSKAFLQIPITTITHHVLKVSFPAFLTSPLCTPSPVTRVFGLAASAQNLISPCSSFIIAWTCG